MYHLVSEYSWKLFHIAGHDKTVRVNGYTDCFHLTSLVLLKLVIYKNDIIMIDKKINEEKKVGYIFCK
jgi:hypothetical protein